MHGACYDFKLGWRCEESGTRASRTVRRTKTHGIPQRSDDNEYSDCNGRSRTDAAVVAVPPCCRLSHVRGRARTDGRCGAAVERTADRHSRYAACGQQRLGPVPDTGRAAGRGSAVLDIVDAFDRRSPRPRGAGGRHRRRFVVARLLRRIIVAIAGGHARLGARSAGEPARALRSGDRTVEPIGLRRAIATALGRDLRHANGPGMRRDRSGFHCAPCASPRAWVASTH